MAEQVQAILDSFVTPLRNLLERGVFSEEEIKSIVARRRSSEYLLKRRTVRKADYLRYLEQETQLETLRVLRMKQRSIAKHEVGDKHIVQHLHFIYHRLLRKFRSDVSLFVQYIDFCKSTSSFKTLGRIYAQALQFHSRNIGLWMEAASHEFFQQGSVGNARVLLQRALRVNTTSQKLWLQYFVLELHYIQKLKGRKQVLMGDDDDDKIDENVDDFAIATVVFNNAVSNIPQDVVFRLQFLDECRMFPSTDKLEEHIMNTIARDFETDPQAWIARAAFIANKSKKTDDDSDKTDDSDEEPVSKHQKTTSDINPVFQILEQAIDTLPTAEMYTKAVQFLQSYQADDDDEQVQLFIHKLLIQARDKEITSTELTLEEANVLVHEGKLQAAMQTLKDHALSVTTMNESTIQVWLQWAKLCAGIEENKMLASQVLQMALDKTPVYQGKEYMVLLLELFGALLMERSTEIGDADNDKLAPLFEKLLLLSAGTDTAPFHDDDDECIFGIPSVAVACLQYFRLAKNEHAQRKVYEQVLYRSNYGSSASNKTGVELQALQKLLDESIDLENSSSNDVTKKRKQRLKRLYEMAIKLFEDANPSLADSYRSRRDANVRYS